jgi:hypothetical protein
MSTLTIDVTAKPAGVPAPWYRFWPRLMVPRLLLLRIPEVLAVFFVLFLLRGCPREKLNIRFVSAVTAGLLIILTLGLTSCSGAGTGAGAGGGGGGTPVNVQVSVQGTSGNATVNFGAVTLTIP